MLPPSLNKEQFANYPAQAKALAVKNIDLMRGLPLSFLPLLLRETIAYDWRFPAEKREIENQFRYLRLLSPEQRASVVGPFARLQMADDLEKFDWVNSPVQFSEKLSAYLWASHQMEDFRKASIEYVHRVNGANPAPALPTHRLVIAVIGQGAEGRAHQCFLKLRPHGVHYTNVVSEAGMSTIFEAVTARSKAHPEPFAHWYIDGDLNAPLDAPVACVSYHGLEGARQVLLSKMIATMQPGGGGPELLRTRLVMMQPEEVGLPGGEQDAVLSRFKLSLLTEGSGTQIFSTSFVQWAARETLRRAQPLTLLARFTPRQRESLIRRPESGEEKAAVDPEASLIDADMGAYYTWINEERLPEAERATFLTWFEGQKEAFASGPGLAAATTEDTAIGLGDILKKIA